MGLSVQFVVCSFRGFGMDGSGVKRKEARSVAHACCGRGEY